MKTTLLACLLVALATSAFAAETQPPAEGFIDGPGGPVWYKISGDGPGIPILTLHGGPGGTSCGYELFAPIGDQRPVVRYDQLGSGRSGRPNDPSLWTVDYFVEELHMLRQELGLTQVHLLGHSWGGALAAAYVIEKGTSGIASVTLSSPLLSTPLWVADANLLRGQLPAEVQATLREHEQAGTTDSEEYKAASEVFYKRHIYAGERLARPPECTGAPGSEAIYKAMWGPSEFFANGTLIDFDVTDRLHEIDVPVLFITGEFDEARPETVAGFQKLVPGSRMAVIMGAAHASYGKKTGEYLAVLESFLESVEGENQ